MNLCPPYSPWLSRPLCIVWWKPVCDYVSLFVCPSHPACGPLSCLECVHASVHEFVSSWLPTSGPPPMHSLIETGCPCIAMCLCPSHLISIPTPCLECVHASVHGIMCTWLPRSGPDPMHSLMETWMPLYRQCVCFPVTSFVPTPCFKCVHTSVHEFMSHLTVLIWSSPMHSLIETGCPCIAVCLCPSHLISDPTPLFRMCTCISPWIYVHLTVLSWSSSYV